MSTIVRKDPATELAPAPDISNGVRLVRVPQDYLHNHLRIYSCQHKIEQLAFWPAVVYDSVADFLCNAPTDHFKMLGIEEGKAINYSGLKSKSVVRLLAWNNDKRITEPEYIAVNNDNSITNIYSFADDSMEGIEEIFSLVRKEFKHNDNPYDNNHGAWGVRKYIDKFFQAMQEAERIRHQAAEILGRSIIQGTFTSTPIQYHKRVFLMRLRNIDNSLLGYWPVVVYNNMDELFHDMPQKNSRQNTTCIRINRDEMYRRFIAISDPTITYDFWGMWKDQFVYCRYLAVGVECDEWGNECDKWGDHLQYLPFHAPNGLAKLDCQEKILNFQDNVVELAKVCDERIEKNSNGSKEDKQDLNYLMRLRKATNVASELIAKSLADCNEHSDSPSSLNACSSKCTSNGNGLNNDAVCISSCDSKATASSNNSNDEEYTPNETLLDAFEEDNDSVPSPNNDVVPESVDTVEGSVSIASRSSSGPQTKASFHKGKGRNQKCSVKRRRRSRKKKSGSRLVWNKNSTNTTKARNDRTCLIDAVHALLSADEQLNAATVYKAMESKLAPEGDTSIESVNEALTEFGMVLRPVTGQYRKEGGLPYHLLQEHDCKLVINIKLTNTQGQTMNHSVAWDGNIIHDHPKICIVNRTTDREYWDSSNAVFHKLYPKKFFSSWQITNVFLLETFRELG